MGIRMKEENTTNITLLEAIRLPTGLKDSSGDRPLLGDPTIERGQLMKHEAREFGV
jgi:hypothetical protein